MKKRSLRTRQAQKVASSCDAWILDMNTNESDPDNSPLWFEPGDYVYRSDGRAAGKVLSVFTSKGNVGLDTEIQSYFGVGTMIVAPIEDGSEPFQRGDRLFSRTSQPVHERDSTVGADRNECRVGS